MWLVLIGICPMSIKTSPSFYIKFPPLSYCCLLFKWASWNYFFLSRKSEWNSLRSIYYAYSSGYSLTACDFVDDIEPWELVLLIIYTLVVNLLKLENIKSRIIYKTRIRVGKLFIINRIFYYYICHTYWNKIKYFFIWCGKNLRKNKLFYIITRSVYMFYLCLKYFVSKLINCHSYFSNQCICVQRRKFKSNMHIHLAY